MQIAQFLTKPLLKFVSWGENDRAIMQGCEESEMCRAARDIYKKFKNISRGSSQKNDNNNAIPHR